MYYRKNDKPVSDTTTIENFKISGCDCDDANIYDDYNNKITKSSMRCSILSIVLSFAILVLIIVPIFITSYANFITQNNTCIGCYTILLFLLIISIIFTA